MTAEAIRNAALDVGFGVLGYKSNEFKLTRFAQEIERITIERCAVTVDRFISGDGIVDDVWIHEISEAIRGLK